MLAKLFDDTFTYDMVGQAGKRLGADDEVRIGEFYNVEILGADGIDLVGKVIK